MPMQARWRLLVLACVLANLLAPALASASTGLYAETRVRGLDLRNPHSVGAERTLTLGTYQGYGLAYDDFASDFLLAARGIDNGRTLYRAVGADELADIQAAGRYRVAEGMSEGKYFFETPEQASSFARQMGDQPYTTTSVTVSPPVMSAAQPINPAGEGPGFFFATPDVPSGPVTIFNYSVLP